LKKRSKKLFETQSHCDAVVKQTGRRGGAHWLYKRVLENQNPAHLFFRSALLPAGWAKNVRLTYLHGRIVAIEWERHVRRTARSAAGAPANIVTLNTDPSDAAAWARSIGASRENLVDCVWADGRKCVTNGRHPLAEAIQSGFQAVIAKLL
jgi:hypothetical protein